MSQASKVRKPYWEMNTEELAEATAEFDREFVVDEFDTPSLAAQAEWQKAKEKTAQAARERDAEK